ncbi:hypothetical protein GCM10010168_53400 [Actinoplanes ianthinogenes]|uniref:HNH nuclease domain-containing protein n=3 Tax=Actinoplanes ianthinogenes TaxID=122358 RepID=A0ABM7LQZ0_9ACTN|nr:hypothetical protein Aiant_23190 [Actinoplanes ianthinogenes]GGR28581.1 hypothetical protein GCM10010168_53400 [Actinoplanes ianthinogenes]
MSPFAPARTWQRRHPGACHREHERRRRQAGRREGRHTAPPLKGPWSGERDCQFCGTGFLAKAPTSSTCYADECQRRHNRERMRGFLRRYESCHGHPYRWKRDPAKRRAYAEARRALQRGASEAEPVVRAVVFERDAWTCGLCDEPINPDLRFPDRWSASIDHVVPLARGGSHTLDNLQAAHLTCNTSKGARAVA